MEDLDAELLAVTDGQKRTSTARDDASDSGAEFDGIADSEPEDDYQNDVAVDDEDDEEDDDEYGLDDDDDEYGSKRKGKKKESRRGKKKSSRSKARSTDRKSSGKKKGTSSPGKDDEEEFVYQFDQSGYGDAEDRERLRKMNEVERELLLEYRIETRSKAYMLWKKGKEMMARGEGKEDPQEGKRGRSSGRTKTSLKSDALQALAEDKRNKKASRPVDMDLSDADSEPDRPSRRERKREDALKAQPKLEDVPMDPDEGPELRYVDLVTVEKDGAHVTSPLFLRRNTLIELSQKAYFERVVVGLYARVRSGIPHEDGYILCRVVGVVIGKVYELGNGLRTNLLLTLQSGKQRQNFSISHTSGSHPTEREFKLYCDRCRRNAVDLPRRDQVEALLKKSKDMIVDKKVEITKGEETQFRENREILYPERVKWTQKLAEVKTALDIKKEELKQARELKLEGEISTLEHDVRELQQRADEVQAKEEKYVLKTVKNNTSVFQTVAKRNDALNSVTERLAATRRNLESDNRANPFARVDTSGKSYFTINAEQEEADERRERNVNADWRTVLSVWEPVMKKRKISEAATDKFYDVALPALDVFKQSVDEISSVQDMAWSSDVDAVYGMAEYTITEVPNGSKEISLAEWNSQRGG